MKTTILNLILTLLVAIPLHSTAQTNPVDKIFEKYSDADGFTSVTIAKGLFELFADIDADDPGFDEFQQAVKGLESLKLLSYSTKDGNIEQKAEFHNDMVNSIPYNDYQELMTVKDSKANVNFYSKSDRSIITEMLMVVSGPDEEVLLSLKGNIDLKHIAKLGSSMNLGGIDYLSKMHHN